MNRNIHFYEPNDAYGFLSNFSVLRLTSTAPYGKE